jgi:hypothetical protein
MPLFEEEELRLLHGGGSQQAAPLMIPVAQREKPKSGNRVARAIVNRLLPRDTQSNIRSNVGSLFGTEFAPEELKVIENTVLDNITLDQITDFAMHPMGKNDYPNAPLTPDQIKRFDRLVAGMPNDPLSVRAKNAYAKARAPGGRLVKR